MPQKKTKINNKNIKKVVNDVFAGKGFISVGDYSYEARFMISRISFSLLINKIHKYRYYYDTLIFREILSFFKDDIVEMNCYFKKHNRFVFSEYSNKILDKKGLIEELKKADIAHYTIFAK